MLDKYKSAATVVASALAGLIKECVEGASVVELCNKGDKLVEEGVAALYNKVKGTPKGKSITRDRVGRLLSWLA